MNTNTGGKPHKRGQRKNNLDISQRFFDRLSPSVLETSRVAQDERASVSPEILTLEGPFKRYYTARQAAGVSRSVGTTPVHTLFFSYISLLAIINCN
ncbi:hypothetical protein D3C73_1282680 [compost metagenome]